MFPVLLGLSFLNCWTTFQWTKEHFMNRDRWYIDSYCKYIADSLKVALRIIIINYYCYYLSIGHLAWAYRTSFLVPNSKCQKQLSLNQPYKPLRSFRRRRLRFTSSIKCPIRQFHVAVVQKRQRNVQKECDARAKLLFCPLNLLLFWRSRCHLVVGS